MMLTGKAKEDFEYWLFERQVPEEYYNRELMSVTCLNALIIEWFDGVGIYIEIIRNEGYFEYIVDEDWDYGFESRKEATAQAIKKANEIYNAILGE